MRNDDCPMHPRLGRREFVTAGAIGLLGIGTDHLQRLCAAGAPETVKRRRVIFIFLSGGLAQHESFDPKPQAPAESRGEFRPIRTKSIGVHICEHLPKLAARSDKWALVRSLTHPYNEHSQGHMAMLTGRTEMPPGFDPSRPKPTDHPSIAALTHDLCPPQHNLPPAIVLPEKLVHRTGRVLPGQFAGTMGRHRDPFFLECCRFNPSTYGAWPQYGFHHARGGENPREATFMAPNLSLSPGLTKRRLSGRMRLLRQIDAQQRALARLAETAAIDRFQELAVSMLTKDSMRRAFDITRSDDRTLDRYGRHVFGWSLLVARQLVEAGVHLVQVNLGNNETWDTHGNAFPHLRNYLLPPMDQAVSALIDDLEERGLLDETLIVMAGEFGRAPKITHLAQAYALPGRDHWGAVQSVFLAGGGVRGGTVIGSSDKIGGQVETDPQRPENLAATIYQALGLPRTSTWGDLLERPMPLYHGEPIGGLT